MHQVLCDWSELGLWEVAAMCRAHFFFTEDQLAEVVKKSKKITIVLGKPIKTPKKPMEGVWTVFGWDSAETQAALRGYAHSEEACTGLTAWLHVPPSSVGNGSILFVTVLQTSAYTRLTIWVPEPPPPSSTEMIEPRYCWLRVKCVLNGGLIGTSPQFFSEWELSMHKNISIISAWSDVLRLVR